MDSIQSGHGSSHRNHRDLKPLKSKDDVKRFLDAIREDFLSTVNSRESGLEDALVQNGVLKCDSDVESLHHYPIRKDESRRLWTILCSVDHKIFISSALPVLCDKYHHIIPLKFWKGQYQPNGRDRITSQAPGEASENVSEHTCIRCAAKRRVREKAMLDLLYGCNLISFDDYSTYTREPLKLNWDLIFKTVNKIHPDKVKTFCGKFQKLLRDYALSVPENLEDSIKHGFPCTCFSQPELNSSGRGEVSSQQQTQDPWRYYSGRKSCRRGSDVSTDTSVYPDSEEESESYYSSHTCTVRRTTLSSLKSTCSHLPAGLSESEKEISHDHLHPMSRGTQTTSSIVNETKKLQDSHALEATGISEQRPDNEIPDAAAKCADRLAGNTNQAPDDLWKSFKMVDRRLKKRPALKEVLQRMVAQDILRRSTKKGSQGATQELEHSFPECTCQTEKRDVPESELAENETEILRVIKELIDFLTESETEDPDVKEERTSPPPSLPCAASTKVSPTTLVSSSEECGVEETMDDLSVDTSEETAIFMELCDIVTSRFSANDDLSDHLKTDEEYMADSGQPPTLTVSRRKQLQKSLQGNSCVIF